MSKIVRAVIVLSGLIAVSAGSACSDAPVKQVAGPFCGDGSLDPTETCDPGIPEGDVGACPTSCTSDACSTSTLTGSADACDAECVVEAASCTGGDGCCPAGCAPEADSDCPAEDVCLERECGSVMSDGVTVDCGQCAAAESCMNGSCLNDETITIGQACAQATDCGAGEMCFTEGDTGFPGGYCVSDCQTDVDCPAGATCGVDGTCLLACAGVGDCDRPGYVCAANDDLTQSVCVPGGTGSTELGGPCNETSDCSGGAGATCLEAFPGGYCSRFCDTNDDCPGGSACDSGGYCLATCATSDDCRSEYSCRVDAGESVCLPGAFGNGDVGDTCESASDCVGGDFGFCAGGASFPDNYCSIDCGEGQGTCPTGSFCVAVSDGSICFDSCDSNEDCRAGYECSFDFGDPEVGGCIGAP